MILSQSRSLFVELVWEMNIQVLSDLHLEFWDFEANTSTADLVILAGDIHVGDKGLIWARETIQNCPVLYVLGNHEYCRQTYPKHLQKLKIAAKDTNIHILENDKVTIGGVNFFGCTLWTNFELFGDPRIAGYHCQQIMNDYRRIRTLPNYSKLRTLDIAIIHWQLLRWLKAALQESAGQTNIVITHHGPSRISLQGKNPESMTNAAYVSDLDSFIQDNDIGCWIHGHIHRNSDYKIGGCRVVCNPRGYPYKPNMGFDPTLTIQV